MPKSLLTLFGFLLLIISCRNSPTPSASKFTGAPAQAEVFIITPALLDNEITTHGSILPNEQVELRSEIAGQIIRINFKEGSRVSKGQLLVQIDDSELQPALEKLRIQLKIANDELERKRQLFEIEGISKEEFEAAQLKYTSLESDIRLTEARIRKSRIIAPFSGIIGLRYVSEGDYVTPGDLIARLVETNPVKIEFSVPEMYASQISTETVIEFTAAGSEKKYQATVYAFEPVINAESRSLTVRAIAENKSAELLPGSFAHLKLHLRQIQDALLVPALAVIPDIKGQKLLMIRNGKAVSLPVKTGIQHEDLIQITEGVQSGDTVITTGLLSLKEGMPVQPKIVKQKSK